ncbi:acyl-CoA desaturase [Kocuria rhizophila]|nr:acyl-CoA desaturase [Kocuria rhizophila]
MHDFSRHKPLWWSGVGCLSVGKILENMEIGIMLHGQWDWMNDKDTHSTTWSGTSRHRPSAGQRTHNHSHHLDQRAGKDRDVGNALRMDPGPAVAAGEPAQSRDQPPPGPGFRAGIAIYDVEPTSPAPGPSRSATWEDFKRVMKKLGGSPQRLRGLAPLASLTGSGKASIKGFLAANVIRKHLGARGDLLVATSRTVQSPPRRNEVENESRGTGTGGRPWIREHRRLPYALHERQPLLQIEHHLFPDTPSNSGRPDRTARAPPAVRTATPPVRCPARCSRRGARCSGSPCPDPARCPRQELAHPRTPAGQARARTTRR